MILFYRGVTTLLALAPYLDLNLTRDATITSPLHRSTAPPLHHLTTSPPYHLTTSPPHHLTTSANRLFVLHRGIGSRNGKVLVAGNVWGEDMVLETDALKDASFTHSLTILEVRFGDLTVLAIGVSYFTLQCMMKI